MPSVKQGETKEQFMGRCIPIRHKEHPTEDNKQSVAVCFSMWSEHQKKNSTSSKDTKKDEKKKKKEENYHA
jgi:hypothetical protein